MKYPYPNNKQCFEPVEDIYSLTKKNVVVYPDFSKVDFKDNIVLQSYIKKLEKYWWLFKNLPFVKQIRLSNSITFGVVNENSDIDFFIICKKNRLFLCRFFSILILIFFNLIWIRKKQWGKIDLNFFVEEDSINLYNISLKPIDRYLVYWISHLVLLYSECKKERNLIFEKNKWIRQILYKHPLTQSINLWIKPIFWKGMMKKIIEKMLDNKLGDLLEKVLKFIWIPIMVSKKKKLWDKWRWIIISDKILKFHWKDIRKKVNLLMKIAWK